MVHGILMLRQHRLLGRSRSALPAAFAQSFTLQEHQKACDYGRARLVLGIFRHAFGQGLVLLWLVSGALATLDSLLFAYVPSSRWQPVALLAVVTLSAGLVDLPFALYAQFGIERRFGFNRMGLTTFVADRLKGLALSLVLGVPLLLTIIETMRQFKGYWWVAALLVVGLFQLFVSWLYPAFIAPLFNRFTPLEAGELRSEIEKLVAEAGFGAKDVLVMDASRRSSHGNAYFTGLGRTKRIVFFDTLLAQLSRAEVVAVLAHEIGHLAHGHIKKGLRLSFAITAIMFVVLGVFSLRADFFLALGLTPTYGTILVVLAWLAPYLALPLTPLLNAWSRRHEFEADRYAIARSEAGSLASALLQLYRRNAGSLVVDDWYALWNYSHPPLAQRLAAMAPSRPATPAGN